MQTVTIKNKRYTILFAVIMVVFSSVSIVASNSVFLFSNEIYHGVNIAGIEVGGLSKEAAADKLYKNLSVKFYKPIITIRYNKNIWELSDKDIDYTVNYNSLAQEAYNVGRTGSIFHKIKERYIAIKHGYNLPLNATYNEKKIKNKLQEIADKLNCEPQNALLTFNGIHKSVQPEIVGLKVNILKTLDEIKLKLSSETNTAINLDVEETMPTVVAKDFDEINGIIGSYTTQFNTNDTNRTYNIIQAANSLDHTMIYPGDIFSFNKTVGLRLAANGYKEAPVYIGSDLVPGVGGGVCQVSTTLYNAALLADLKIIERSSHIRPAAYVPLGQDATVADNLIDLSFQNSTDANVYIRAFVYGNQITTVIYGKVDNNAPEIVITSSEPQIIEPNTIVKQDDNLELGKQMIETEGQKGFVVSTYRIKYQDGRQITKEYISTDEYAPVDKIIIVGTKPASKLPAQVNKTPINK